MTTASAPGKVILFGEHAVVSGVPALGSAIDLRATVSVEDLPGRVEIDASNLRLMVTGFTVDPLAECIHTVGSSRDALLATRYISAVLRELRAGDLRVSVESRIPPAAGLGSSAAIVVATLAALNEHLGLKMSREEIGSESYRIEKLVQQGLGSPMDTALSTFGGYQLVSDKIQARKLPELRLVVGYTEQSHDTRTEVAKVQNLRQSYPDVVEPIFQAIGAISKRALESLEEGRLKELGSLMNINHGLLEALGVGTRELSELVYAARGAGGALGAKLTGAGGGGCMIALPPEGGEAEIATAIRQARGRTFAVKTGCEGVRLEG
ncbi:MAG TPA: mevalonate kinase [Methanotrichaceae archaeon]|nr:mevalonate kinase [Methanotrichaceae archaeon]